MFLKPFYASVPLVAFKNKIVHILILRCVLELSATHCAIVSLKTKTFIHQEKFSLQNNFFYVTKVVSSKDFRACHTSLLLLTFLQQATEMPRAVRVSNLKNL